MTASVIPTDSAPSLQSGAFAFVGAPTPEAFAHDSPLCYYEFVNDARNRLREGCPVQQGLFAAYVKKTLMMEWNDGSIREVPVDDQASSRAKAYAARDKSLYYWSKSGLHKSLRRRDYGRAVRWSELLDYCEPGEARRYMRSILFEETRNFRLLGKFADPFVTTRCLIRMFCASPMDWELPGDIGIFSPYFYEVNARLGRDLSAEAKGMDVPREFPDLTGKMGDPQAVFDALSLCLAEGRSAQTTIRALRAGLIEEAKKIAPDMAFAFSKASPVSGIFEEVIALYQYVHGDKVFRDAACSFSHDVCNDVPPFDFPWLDWGVLDFHTREGRKNHRMHGHTTKWGHPNHPRIDLRWGGAEAATLWRYMAVQEFGTVHVPFESVTLPEKVIADFQKTKAPMV